MARTPRLGGGVVLRLVEQYSVYACGSLPRVQVYVQLVARRGQPARVLVGADVEPRLSHLSKPDQPRRLFSESRSQQRQCAAVDHNQWEQNGRPTVQEQRCSEPNSQPGFASRRSAASRRQPGTRAEPQHQQRGKDPIGAGDAMDSVQALAVSTPVERSQGPSDAAKEDTNVQLPVRSQHIRVRLGRESFPTDRVSHCEPSRASTGSEEVACSGTRPTRERAAANSCWRAGSSAVGLYSGYLVRAAGDRGEEHSRVRPDIECGRRLTRKVEDRTMKIQTTKRSISGVILLGLLTSLIAVAWVRYVAAEGERAFAAAGGDAVTIWNANAGIAATAACLAPSPTPSTNRASTR